MSDLPSARFLKAPPFTIMCQEHGRFVNGGPTPSDLWDLVDYGGMVGWVADAYVNTGTPNQVAPTC